MNGKNIIAGFIVGIVSIALAIGITYIITSTGKSAGLSFETAVPLQFTASVTPTGTAITPELTTTPITSGNCTFPLETWMQYPSAWRISSYRLGNKTYNKTEMLEALQKSEADTWSKLLSQIFVVILNQENGADVTGIRTMFSQGVTWLISFPAGSQPSNGDLQNALISYQTLARFNQGDMGIPKCKYKLSDAAPAALPTIASSGTITATRSTRIYPTLTPEPEINSSGSVKKPAAPTARPPTARPSTSTALPPPPPDPLPTDAPTETAAPPPVNATTPPLLPTQPPATSVPPTSIPPTTVQATSVPPTSTPSSKHPTKVAP